MSSHAAARACASELGEGEINTPRDAGRAKLLAVREDWRER